MLERLNDGVEGVAAPPHQHQHVAIAQRPAVAAAAGHRAAFNQKLDLGLDAPCQFYFGACRGNAVEWRAPAFYVLLVVGFRQFPEIDEAGTGVGQCLVHRIGIFRVNAAIDRLVAKHVVDRLQDRRARAERVVERYRIEFQPGVLELPFQFPPAQVEFARRGPLKRKDRLFLVADREHGADHTVARTGAGGEFGNDVRDDIPLPRAGILRLVDQHMIDAAVELVVHPARGHAVEHRQRLVDQVVIVEEAAFLLLAAVVCRSRGRDMQERLGAVADDKRAASLDQGAEAAAFGFEEASNGGIFGRQKFFVTTDLPAASARPRSGIR